MTGYVPIYIKNATNPDHPSTSETGESEMTKPEHMPTMGTYVSTPPPPGVDPYADIDLEPSAPMPEPVDDVRRFTVVMEMMRLEWSAVVESAELTPEQYAEWDAKPNAEEKYSYLTDLYAADEVELVEDERTTDETVETDDHEISGVWAHHADGHIDLINPDPQS